MTMPHASAFHRPNPEAESRYAAAFHGVKRTVERVLAPYDVSKFELPETLRTQFQAADNLIRAVSLDVERAKAELGARRYLAWGNAAADWLEIRTQLARGDSTFLDLQDKIESARTYALGCAEEILRVRRKPEPRTTVEGAPEAQKKRDTSVVWYGAAGLLGAYLLHKWMFDRPRVQYVSVPVEAAPVVSEGEVVMDDVDVGNEAPEFEVEEM